MAYLGLILGGIEIRTSLGRFFDERKEQAGVGTLIVFIAMILVAAIAAGVLLRTSGTLSTKATATGEQAIVEVSTYLKVVSVVGYSSDNTNITSLIIAMQLGAGSGAVDIDDIVMSFQSDGVYTSGIQASSSASGGAANFTFNFIKNVTANDILERGETVEIIYTDLDNDLNMRPNDEFIISLQPKSGQQTYIKKRVPNVISKSYISRWS